MNKSRENNISLTAFQPAMKWFGEMGWKPFDFQLQVWQAYLEGKSGLLNAPTGSGKTYALLVPPLLEALNGQPGSGIRLIWITPIRALAREIENSALRAIDGMGLTWKVGVRTGDTSTAHRKLQRESPPQIIITTPESLHLLLAQKGYANLFGSLKCIVVDEWHELVGSKRGVQVELALSRIKSLVPSVRIWGISATIGNLEQAADILLGIHQKNQSQRLIIRADLRKQTEVISVLPEAVDVLPWAGHLGIRMLDQVIDLIRQSTSTLIFTNTRSFAEVWYQKLLERAPDLAGVMAMHHGSISAELRLWVEEQLHEGHLKVVVCTSSLDLGVDFRPVETVIQVGSPKGVARFVQRAGRSGHRPGAVSRIYFVPTHSLELVEAAALREAIREGIVESRLPYVRSFDVLIQYLVTLAVSDGFYPEEIYREVKSTFSFASLTPDEWLWVLNFITTGGDALQAYDEYRKVIVDTHGRYVVDDRRTAQRHRLSIGTITGDNQLMVKYVTGKYLGTVEEYFISQLSIGDTFWFAGRVLELVRIKDMEVHVRRSNKKSGRVPSWMGGRMPLSSQLGAYIRNKLDEAAQGNLKEEEMAFLQPLFNLQRERSHLPQKNEFLIEYFETAEGHHVLMYPFEGRFVHEGMAALIAYRLTRIQPFTFSIAMNDYGFELLSDRPIPVEEALETDLFSQLNLLLDIQASINASEMARRKFRDIAAIAGLMFKGFPGKPIRDRHLQATAGLFFQVFQDYDPGNLLYRQAFEEVMDFQLEEYRLREALNRINRQKIIVTRPEKPTPFAFPIMVDRLRERLTTEQLKDRILKMAARYAS
ncbi:MAG: ligase-associated DNA damage response DEXH box helicase [Cyclobacteriaceae bacterium]|nr:ligase-associated DNA damage response DEXH box helicase [Cyclobacteriaceae bacterium]